MKTLNLPPRTKQVFPNGEDQKIRALGWTPHTVEGWWTGRNDTHIAFTDGVNHIVVPMQ